MISCRKNIGVGVNVKSNAFGRVCLFVFLWPLQSSLTYPLYVFVKAKEKWGLPIWRIFGGGSAKRYGALRGCDWVGVNILRRQCYVILQCPPMLEIYFSATNCFAVICWQVFSLDYTWMLLTLILQKINRIAYVLKSGLCTAAILRSLQWRFSRYLLIHLTQDTSQDLFFLNEAFHCLVELALLVNVSVPY